MFKVDEPSIIVEKKLEVLLYTKTRTAEPGQAKVSGAKNVEPSSSSSELYSCTDRETVQLAKNWQRICRFSFGICQCGLHVVIKS